MPYDFEQFKKDVKKTGEIVGEKAKEFSDTAKLKVDIKSKEHELNKLYCALGKVYFAAHQNDDEETLPEAVMFRGIKRAEGELAQLKQELAGDNANVDGEATAEAEGDAPGPVDIVEATEDGKEDSACGSEAVKESDER